MQATPVRVATRAQLGLLSIPVSVEATVKASRNDTLEIVGLPKQICAVRARHLFALLKKKYLHGPIGQVRVRVLGLEMLGQVYSKFTPAEQAELLEDVKRFDLAIAVAIVAAVRGIELEAGYEYYGELTQNGDLEDVPGLLASMTEASRQLRCAFVPEKNTSQLSLLQGARLIAMPNLAAVIEHIDGSQTRGYFLSRTPVLPKAKPRDQLFRLPISQMAMEAIVVAAAGGHGLLLLHESPTLRSQVASALRDFLPPLNTEQALEAVARMDAARNHGIGYRWGERPLVSPRAGSTEPIVLGAADSDTQKTSAAGRAHRGVLMIDEPHKLDVSHINALAHQLKKYKSSVADDAPKQLPSCYQLVVAMPPCRCSARTSGAKRWNHKPCKCSPEQIAEFRNEACANLLQHCDVRVNLSNAVPIAGLTDDEVQQISIKALNAFAPARAWQTKRAKRLNAQLTDEEIRRICELSKTAHDVLAETLAKHGGTELDRIGLLRTARTFADMAVRRDLNGADIKRAAQLRFEL